MSVFFSRLRHDNSGATAIEYGILVVLLGLGLIAISPALRSATIGSMNTIGNSVEAEVK